MIAAKDLPAPSDFYPVRRALISVYDKTGLVEFARKLEEQGVALISTGGTARTLVEAGLHVTEVSTLTGFPEILDGRVKTLHPSIHGGLLARRNDPDDLAELTRLSIEPIDLVVVNLYPFADATASPDVTDGVAIENIDVGGPTMVRAAAKNFFFVGVVTSPAQYDGVLQEMYANGGALSLATRRRFAASAFSHTATYDRAVAGYFNRQDGGSSMEEGGDLLVKEPLAQVLRYGENPHQRAGLFGNPHRVYEQLHGKELSFNNILDLSAALFLIEEFEHDGPTCAILKHTNPCGVAMAEDLEAAYRRAFATDTQSPFGGIVVVNSAVDRATAEALSEIFIEIVIAPEYEEGVLDYLRQKQNRRLIRIRNLKEAGSIPDIRSVAGGYLVQDRDGPLADFRAIRDEWKVVTSRRPTEAEWRDLDFAWRVAKHVKSNAIVYAAGRATLGIGAGQMSRVDASEIAVLKGKKGGHSFSGCVVASDAFFPFADGLIAAAESGAHAVVQPGGSMRDEEVIRAANEHDLAMVFTGIRHFRH